MLLVYELTEPMASHLQMPSRKALPLPATRSRTISPSSLATTSDRYVLARRKTACVARSPDSLDRHLGTITLIKLRNWCRNAMFNPGLIFVGGGPVAGSYFAPAWPDELRNSLRCASKVVNLVGKMVTLLVESLYGTNIVRLPSFPRSPLLRRTRRLPVSRSAFFLLYLLYPPYPPVTMAKESARVATRRVVRELRGPLRGRASSRVSRQA